MIEENIGDFKIECKYNSQLGHWSVFVYKKAETKTVQKDALEFVGRDYGLLNSDYALMSGKRIIDEFEK